MNVTLPRPPAPRRSIFWAAKAVQVRLRFFAALAVAFLVIGRWDVLRTYWDRWTSPPPRDPAMGAVSASTEYFCPMDPGVLSDWPSKCPICYMSLVRRDKGDMGPLPNGVVARVQLTPDRIQLGGIRVETARYLPLEEEIKTIGTVEGATIRAEVGEAESSRIEPGGEAEVTPEPPDGTRPIFGRVVAVEPGKLTVELPKSTTALGHYASIRIHRPLADREPFRSMPRGEPPLRSGSPRFVYACPDHPDVLQEKAGRCPKDNHPLERLDLARNQKLAWWCPMHPKVESDEPGRECAECGGMALVPRLVSYAPPGEVLAVPESAVIDTGTRSIVYVERMPGMFDGVEVRLGPRCGGSYPVVSGLEAGQKVAAAGAFLVDAETRLNPSLAAGYFGASRTEASPVASATKAETPDFAALAPADRKLATTQATCPVTGKKLGSMGTPVKIEVKGRTVFLCCEGCETAIRKSPDKYLAKSKAAPAPAHHP